MSQTGSIPLPAAHALRKLGRDLALARRKRGISTSDMAARLFVSRDTLWLDWIASKKGESLDDVRARDKKGFGTVEDSDAMDWMLHEPRAWGVLRGVHRRAGTVQKDWVVLKAYELPETFAVAVRGHNGWSKDPNSTARFALAVSVEAETCPVAALLRTVVPSVPLWIPTRGGRADDPGNELGCVRDFAGEVFLETPAQATGLPRVKLGRSRERLHRVHVMAALHPLQPRSVPR
jgi:hypothetical protein